MLIPPDTAREKPAEWGIGIRVESRLNPGTDAYINVSRAYTKVALLSENSRRPQGPSRGSGSAPGAGGHPPSRGRSPSRKDSAPSPRAPDSTRRGSSGGGAATTFQSRKRAASQGANPSATSAASHRPRPAAFDSSSKGASLKSSGGASVSDALPGGSREARESGNKWPTKRAGSLPGGSNPPRERRARTVGAVARPKSRSRSRRARAADSNRPHVRTPFSPSCSPDIDRRVVKRKRRKRTKKARRFFCSYCGPTIIVDKPCARRLLLTTGLAAAASTLHG